MRQAPRWIYVAVALIAASTAVLLLTANAGAIGLASQPRTITIQAHQFAFEPSTIVVNQGDHVTVQLSSSDSTHGFYLDSYGVELAAMPGQSPTAQFVVDRAGTFRFRCAITCGPLHPFMIGELTVLPAGPSRPSPFLAVIGLTAVLAVVTVGWLWKSTAREEAKNA